MDILYADYTHQNVFINMFKNKICSPILFLSSGCYVGARCCGHVIKPICSTAQVSSTGRTAFAVLLALTCSCWSRQNLLCTMQGQEEGRMEGGGKEFFRVGRGKFRPGHRGGDCGGCLCCILVPIPGLKALQVFWTCVRDLAGADSSTCIGRVWGLTQVFPYP